ncbi:dihydroorotate dehydrogenase (quinone), mitochondrial [Strongylocentrotus purpuratus]|uniref:Dihydroorotate dehydrogenase (quinone), mitochondrial n=1 Tax=Strongylocentrotus purpuratus TaxID=7668 RepID=A0A7M7RI91_STRPU|nr:dihydroorotate dehydrogenase (quinone), mitochondrial [Strongylocentrotus purpuratus]
MSLKQKLQSATSILGGGAVLFVGINIANGNEKFYRDFVMPVFRWVDPERAHVLAVKAAAWGLVPRSKYKDPPILHCKAMGLEFTNPLGMAAGFDKHAEAMNGLLKTGFGFVEVGSVTPEPQEGNPKPRVFRLTEDKAIINRYGFNSVGHDVVHQRLKERQKKAAHLPQDQRGIIGVNLGKNKTSPSAVQDYVDGVKKLGCFGDYLVINVSSPNTPGLRAMQGRQQLAELIEQVVATRDLLPCTPKPPVLVKIAPDLTQADKEDIAAVVMGKKGSVEGIIVTNTTITRPESLEGKHKGETGGLSGVPLKDMSTATVSDMYRLTNGKMTIVGVGGVSSGQDAYEKIKAGASLVQLYTAFAYEGPPLPSKIKRELEDLLKKDGFSSVSEAVGADHR